MIHGLQISDEHSDLLFFGWPVGHLRDLIPPPSEECSKGLIEILTGGFQIPGGNIQFLIVGIMINEDSNDIFPRPGL